MIKDQANISAYENYAITHIPLEAGDVNNWRSIQLDNNTEPLLPIGPYSPYKESHRIATSSVYFGEHSTSPYIKKENKIDGSLIGLYARKSVIDRLIRAAGTLASNYRLMVFDAYRPLEVQASLYNRYRSDLKKMHPNLSSSLLDAETQKYVSLPSNDVSKPSPHSTGGSVDMAIIEIHNSAIERLDKLESAVDKCSDDDDLKIMLEMQKSWLIRHYSSMSYYGTEFDYGGSAAALSHYEKILEEKKDLSKRDIVALQNRRILFNLMSSVGMQPFNSEWWHYNSPESQMGSAALKKSVALHGAIKMSSDNLQHEKFRLALHELSIKMQENIMVGKNIGSLALRKSLNKKIYSFLLEHGDPRLAYNCPIKIITPEN